MFFTPSPELQKVLKASLMVALSAILYGFLGYLGTSIVHDNISIAEMQFWRFLVASLWLLAFVARKHFSRQSVRPDKRFLLSLFFLGAIGYAGSSEFFFVACQSIGTGLAMVVFFSYPAMIAVASWLFQGKKMTFATLSILLVMMAGLFLLKSAPLQPLSLSGILFGMAAAACYAFYVIVSKQFSARTIDSGLLSMVVCLGCAVSFLSISLHTLHFTFPVTTKSGCYILLLGVFATAIPIQLMLAGLKHISSMRASIISVLEPVVTIIVGVLLLDESFSLMQGLGGLLILGSALLIQFQKEL